MLARISGGKPKTIMNDVTSIAQANSGIRRRSMPGARPMRMATIISTAAATAAISEKVTPISQKSALSPGDQVASVSGTYMNQPESGTASKRKLEYRNRPPNR